MSDNNMTETVTEKTSSVEKTTTAKKPKSTSTAGKKSAASTAKKSAATAKKSPSTAKKTVKKTTSTAGTAKTATAKKTTASAKAKTVTPKTAAADTSAAKPAKKTSSAAKKPSVKKADENSANKTDNKTVKPKTAKAPKPAPVAEEVTVEATADTPADVKTADVSDDAVSVKVPDITPEKDGAVTAAESIGLASEAVDEAAPVKEVAATEDSASEDPAPNAEAVVAGGTETATEPVSEEPAASRKGKKKRSVAGIIFTSVGAVIIAFLFFVAVTLAVDKFVNKSAVPSFFGYSTLFVTTGSMSGTIEDGDMIIVHDEAEYKIGDIVTFLPDGDTVPTTHRIIRVDGDKFYTRGDANNADDTHPITQENIIGKVVSTLPHVGLFFRWLRDEFGWVYIVAVAVVIVVGVVLLKQFPAAKKEK